MNEQIDQRYKEWRNSLSTVMTCNQCHDMRFILSNDEGLQPDLQKCDDCLANKRDGYFTSDDQAKAYVLGFIGIYWDL